MELPRLERLVILGGKKLGGKSDVSILAPLNEHPTLKSIGARLGDLEELRALLPKLTVDDRNTFLDELD
jgi:hypothetical protein